MISHGGICSLFRRIEVRNSINSSHTFKRRYESTAHARLCDSHRHIWEGILRNIGTDAPLEGEKGYLANVLGVLAPAYRPEDQYAGNLVSALGARDAGITTLLDRSHIQAAPEHTESVIKALQDSGMRVVFAYGHPWWGDPIPEHDDEVRRIAKQ